MSKAIAGKKYKHYKGGEYEVLALAQHSETLEELVVYKALYQTEEKFHDVWVRPREMFEEQLESGEERFSEM